MKRHILLVLMVLASAVQVFSQVISVDARVDRQRILIGEPLELTISASAASGTSITWPQFDTFPRFEILDRRATDTIATVFGFRLVQTVILTSWDSGRWNIPSIRIQNMATTPIPVDVTYSPMDPEQPYHDIKDIMDVIKPEQPSWYWYILLLALLLVLFLLFFPRNKGGRMERTAPPGDPFREAGKRLAALDPSQDSVQFYTELTALFRTYVHQRKQIYSYSKTTSDMVVQLKQLKMDQEIFTSLAQVLRLSDLVKFARMEASVQEKQRSKEIMKKAIEEIENAK